METIKIICTSYSKDPDIRASLPLPAPCQIDSKLLTRLSLEC